MDDRAQVLQSLVALDRPLPTILASLRRFPWDSDGDLIVLRFEDIFAILGRFLIGELSPGDVESWANSIESREDIGFDGAGGEIAKDAIHQLANPELSGPLTGELARAWRDSLEGFAPIGDRVVRRSSRETRPRDADGSRS